MRTQIVVGAAVLLWAMVPACHNEPGPRQEPQAAQTALAPAAVPASDDAGVGSVDSLAAAWDAQFDGDAALSPGTRATAEQPIIDALAKLDAVESVQPVECRATRCRLVIKANTREELESAFGTLFGAPGPAMADEPLVPGPVVISRRVEASDGSVVATIYLGRGSALKL